MKKIKEAMCDYCCGILQNTSSSNDNWFHINDEDRLRCVIAKSRPVMIYEKLLPEPHELDIIKILNEETAIPTERNKTKTT